MSNKNINAKIARIAASKEFRTVDLFAGCGGFSLGFHRAGFSILGAIEIDPQASESHSLNFSRLSAQRGAQQSTPLDISKVDPAEYLRSKGVSGSHKNSVDVLIGGPPCQAFARIGRAKLREISNDPIAHKSDKRANLVEEYIRFVRAFLPLVVVIENVPDMMNQSGENIVANVCKTLSEAGYECRYTLLNAAYYGVPQYRERVFVIGYHKSLGIAPSFPSPSNAIDLPQGYLGSRRVAMKPIADSGKDCRWFVKLEAPEAGLPGAVSCEEALCDLPKIIGHLSDSVARKGVRRVDAITGYSTRRPSAYGIMMRQWPGFPISKYVTAHVTRSLPRDYETFRRMQPGDQYPEAYNVAVQIYKESQSRCDDMRANHVESQRKKGWDEIVPPYDPGKFPNKWWKIDPKRPSKTLTAHIGKDTYSHIHYDSTQARTISVREAARLQSFPDGFQFAGAMNAAFRQIGNAVPPLLAFAIAKHIRTELNVAMIRRGLEMGSTS